MTISDVMKLTGLTRKAIYLYEERGLLFPGRVPLGINRRREYSDADIDRLVTISRLRALNVPLDEISRALCGGCRVDIVLQEHLVNERARLAELTRSAECIEALLKKLPPNSCIEDFDKAADGLLPRSAQSEQVKMDYSGNFTRRIAMQLYEAFFDKPLDTIERMDAWFQLLTKLESALSPDFLEAFESYYCRMSAEQVHEDYRLRHRLVHGYPCYGKVESAAKARELFEELRQLTVDDIALGRWTSYEADFMRPVLRSLNEASEDMLLLSNVYPKYRASFENVVNSYLKPMLQTAEGRSLTEQLRLVLKEPDYPRMDYLIFFDFYNNTLRQVLFE